MTYEYDRFEREEGSGAFLMGLLAGTVLGAGLGMLFAPRPGSELRTQLTEQAGRLRNTASDAYQQAADKVTHMAERGKDAYERARSTGTTGETGTGLGGGTTGGLGTTTGGGYGTTGAGS
jgi:gas vesicle protein